ncbi:DMT family transporter [Tistrella mobilis]|uniref:DMT family transporter n=1 Tax=Tistrella mobilis TaxID=171437 RepID=UPI00355857AB
MIRTASHTQAPTPVPVAPAPVPVGPTLIDRTMPAGFVLLWSTGYIGGAIALRGLEPLTMSVIRFALATLVMAGIVAALRIRRPARPMLLVHAAVTGLLMHGLQFGGLYGGMAAGVPAGTAALIMGLMPVVVTVAAGPFLGEWPGRRHLAGLALGVAGVGLVVGQRLGDPGQAPLHAYLLVAAGLAGLSFGSLWQKRFCAGLDLRLAGMVQTAAGGLVLVPAALLLETGHMVWTAEVTGAVVWLALVNSIAAIAILGALMRRGAAARAAGLFFLVPSATAIMAWLLLGEPITPLMLAGIALSAAGVRLGRS